MPEVTIVGIDCATVDERIGIATGRWARGQLAMEAGLRAGKGTGAMDMVAEACRRAPGPVLLTLDAPLGWPAPLADALAHHRAGQPLPAEPDALFLRETDRLIHAWLGKKPLEVGADRIARTAHAALALLAQVGARLGLEIPLAWEPGRPPDRLAAIEVYPAATLIARGIPSGGYKKPANVARRWEIIASLRAEGVGFPADASPFAVDVDVLDAALCVVAGADFLAGNVAAPPDPERARKEGWIWTRPRA